MELEHKHLIVKAEVAGTPLLQDLKFIEDWMRRLIHDIGMVILIEPQVAYCDQENNKGVTAIAALTTSSCSLHIWDEALPLMSNLIYIHVRILMLMMYSTL